MCIISYNIYTSKYFWLQWHYSLCWTNQDDLTLNCQLIENYKIKSLKANFFLNHPKASILNLWIGSFQHMCTFLIHFTMVIHYWYYINNLYRDSVTWYTFTIYFQKVTLNQKILINMMFFKLSKQKIILLLYFKYRMYE